MILWIPAFAGMTSPPVIVGLDQTIQIFSGWDDIGISGSWIPVRLFRCNPTEAKYFRFSQERQWGDVFSVLHPVEERDPAVQFTMKSPC